MTERFGFRNEEIESLKNYCHTLVQVVMTMMPGINIRAKGTLKIGEPRCISSVSSLEGNNKENRRAVTLLRTLLNQFVFRPLSIRPQTLPP